MSDHSPSLPSPAALRILESLPPYSTEIDQLALNTQLRRHGALPKDILEALTQWELRDKAALKFGTFAQHMLFTKDGLQQATRLNVAAAHADRFRTAGFTEVFDLGCGIGAESMAMAALDLSVTAIEIDPVTAAYAAYNLAPFPNAEVQCADALSVAPSPGAGRWFDPARRELHTGSQHRVFDPESFTPSFTDVLAIAEHHSTGIKLGPGHPHDAIPAFSEAQWTAVGAEAVELALYTGALTNAPGRWSACVISKDGRATLTTDPSIANPIPGLLGDYIYEPNAAVIRSQGIGTLAHRLQASLVSDRIAYLTSNELHQTPFATAYRVLDVLPLKTKVIAAYLRDRSIGRLVVKKRGVDIDPSTFRKRFKLRGADEATIILTRHDNEHVAIVVERIAA